MTKNLYDAGNELIQVNRADGTSVKTTYNLDGTVASQIDGKGNATTYQYDSLARTIASADPLNRSTRYQYDPASNLIAKLDAKSQTTSYQYDVANQLKGITYSDGTTPSISGLQYDGDGNRLSVSDGTGTSSYSFDSLNRLTQSKDGAGATVGYGYDLNGNLTSLKYPTGNSVSRTFDADSRMASLSDWLGNQETFSYDPNSNLITTTFPASTSEVDSQAFDAADNLISIVDTKSSGDNQDHSKQGSGNGDQGQQTLASFFYTRDGNNQVTSESNKPSHGNQNIQGDNSASKSKTYTYTPLNQLKNVNNSSYSYDPADNLVKLINGTAQTFDSADQLLSSVSPVKDQTGQHGGNRTDGGTVTTAYSYDLNGNRVSAVSASATTTLAYDQVNRLINFNGVASYSYNGDGLRMSKKIGSTTQPMAWDLSEGLPLLLSDSAHQYVYGPGGLPLEQVSSSGTIDFFHHDQLGSTRLLTNSRGQTDGTFTFDPYGNLTNTRDSLATPLLLAGQYLDSESGLYYMRARFYDPTTGGFLTRDRLAGTTRSPYGYATENPMNRSDRSGMGGQPMPQPTCENPAAGLCGPIHPSLTVWQIGLDVTKGTFGNPNLVSSGCQNPFFSGSLIRCFEADFFRSNWMSQCVSNFPSLGSWQFRGLECEGSLYYAVYYFAYNALLDGHYVGAARAHLVSLEWYGLQGDIYVDNLEAQVAPGSTSPFDDHSWYIDLPGVYPNGSVNFLC